ncbi:MAG: DNA polymerase III subunit gamma and tau [Bacteroidetes bacterium OLB9]|nr:MAG: DNA polymerase III subunit gamma and tau [Bacteroidetes bacterium OLB9]
MSKYIVSARKYRPMTFEEVVGQDHVAKTLKNALQIGHLAHAFLFTGPRGVGKTTCARILAKVINCENPKNQVEACNECSSCTSFNDNASFNIFELDAASNNSVESIRMLIDQVRIQPQKGKYKVFIIDEVHMLTSQAFNAFLKTLEEPPEHAIFIMATTEKHKVLPTILSRCQIFDFRRIQISDIVRQLEIICDKENIQAEKQALHAIAEKADGAMRDALSIFDKITSSVSGNAITYKDVVNNLNLLDYEYYFKITDACLIEDIAKVLLTLDEVIKQGFDVEQFVLGLADHFRDLLIAKIPSTIGILEASEELKKRYYDQSQLAQASFLLSGLNMLNQCDIDLVRAKNKRLQVELVLSKLAYLSRAVNSDVFAGSVEAQEKKNSVANVSLNQNTDKPLNLSPNHGSNNTGTTSKPQQVVSQPETTTTNIESSNQSKDIVEPVASSMFGNLDKIRDMVRQSEASKLKAKKELTIEGIQKIWNNYMELNPSISLKKAMELTQMTLQDKTIHVFVPTQVTKDMILQETGLIERIREEMSATDIILDIEVNLERFPEYEEYRTTVTLSNKEKYLEMLKKNPSLGLLSKKTRSKTGL